MYQIRFFYFFAQPSKPLSRTWYQDFFNEGWGTAWKYTYTLMFKLLKIISAGRSGLFMEKNNFNPFSWLTFYTLPYFLIFYFLFYKNRTWGPATWLPPPPKLPMLGSLRLFKIFIWTNDRTSCINKIPVRLQFRRTTHTNAGIHILRTWMGSELKFLMYGSLRPMDYRG